MLLSAARPVGRHSRSRLRPRRAVALFSSFLVVAGLTVVVPSLSPTTAQAAGPPPSSVTDINPNATPTPLFGGRVEQLAIHPVDPQRLLAGTELGGLWQTSDGGDSWTHVDGLPLITVQDVEFAASDPDLVIAVGNYEGSITSRGGVYRSTDGGVTWAKSAGSDPPATCTTESSALSVSIGPGTPGNLPVYVGDVCGVTRSNSSAADSTWNRLDPNGSFNNGLTASEQVEDIEVRQGTDGQLQVDVCGPQGFFRSNDAGGTWSAADPASPLFRSGTSPGVIGNAFGRCNVDVAPGNANIVYLSNFEGGTASGFCAGQLLESRAGGAAGTWTQMGSDVTDSNCRDTFVQVHDDKDADATTYHVYFGTSVRALRQTCDSDNAPSCAPGAANWPRWDNGTPHADPTSIAFDPAVPNGCPLFLAGDGGVFRVTTDGCAATPTIVSANTGLHAFDASQTAGTVWADHTDLYFGTQDNGTYYTGDGGATYINNGPDTYNILADLEGNPAASILRRDCFGCSVFRQAPGATAPLPFTAPPAPWNADFGSTFAGTQFGPASYALILRDAAPDDGVPPAEPAPNWSVFYTTNAGTNWTQLGTNLPAGPTPGAGSGPGSHGQIQASGTPTSPVFYLNLGGSLFRLTGGTLDNSVATNPATLTPLSTTVGQVGAWAVDPRSPSLLYAVSSNNQAIYRSTSAGASWAVDPEVTSLVTSGGYKWRSTAGNQATSIGIDPFSDQIMVGTLSNGIFATVNNGGDWIRVRGSEQIHRALDFVFDGVRDTVFVGSRGRGLWRIDLPEADLRIAKTDSPDPVIAGEQLTYTITVTNDGPDDAAGVTVIDDLPDEVEFITSSIACLEETVEAHDRVTCTIGNLPSGQARTFTLTVLVDRNAVSSAGEPFTMSNTASVSGSDTVDSDDSDNSATTTTVVNDSADLQVTKLCDPATVRAGETAHCTVFVDNHGPSDAREVVLSDQVLSDGTFTISNVQAPNGGTCGALTDVPGGKRFECALGTIAAATSAEPGRKTVTYDVSAADQQEIDNKARARSDTPDPDDTNNIAETTIAVTAVADLELVKSAPASVVAGTQLDYLLTLTNHGPSTGEGVTIEDAVPEGVVVVGVAGSDGASCTAGVAGDPLRPTTCSFGSLPAGSSRTMSVHVAVDPGTTGLLTNDARVTSQTFDPDTSNDLAHSTTSVVTSADVAVTKVDSPDPATAGRPLAYTIRLDNSGPSDARDVRLVDELPGFLTFSAATIQHGSGSCSHVVGNPNELRCELGRLTAGDYVVVIVEGIVKTSAPAGQVLVNQVTATSTTPDPDPSDNTASASTTVETLADLVLTHTSDASTYKPSTTIHYVITLTNNGPSDAVDVVITDLLPPEKYGDYVSNDGGCTFANDLLTCPGQSLPAGATRILQVKFFVQGAKGTLQATATATSDTPDPDTANNSQTRTITRK